MRHVVMDSPAKHIDKGKIHCILTSRLKLTAEGLRKAHELIDLKTTVRNIGLGVDERGEGQPIC